MELEPHEPQKTQPGRTVARFIIGAVPALIGVLLPISHMRRPLVAPAHETVFLAACLGLICLSLALGLYFALERVARGICEHFDKRHNELAARIDVLQRQVDILCENEADRHEETGGELAKVHKGQIGGRKRLETIEKQVLALGNAFVKHGLPAASRDVGSSVM